MSFTTHLANLFQFIQTALEETAAERTSYTTSLSFFFVQKDEGAKMRIYLT
jgi:hypothetical protein